MPDTTMNAWLLESFGEPEHFRKTSVAIPELRPNEVLIRVAATSINPVDCKIRRGERPAISPDLPGILHGDVAGVIECCGGEVSRFQPGDEVYGMVGGFKNLPGTLADFAVADSALLGRKPKNLEFTEAAALPLVTITAWEGLHDRARISNGQHVLVHAGTGGVGHIAAQIAKAAGARVAVTVSSSAKANAVAKLMSDAVEIVNYRDESVEDYRRRLTGERGFDVVYDTVGGPNLAASFAAVRINGQVINILSLAQHDLSPMHLKGLSLHVVFMLLPLVTREGRARHGEILNEATALVESGQLIPLIDTRFSFDQIGDAHRRAESGQQIGKIVVTHPDFKK